MEKARACISEWSVGQYETKLYHSRKESTYSSFVGGLLTLGATVVILAYTIYLLIGVFSLKNRTVQESGKAVMGRGLLLSDFSDSLLNSSFAVEFSPVPTGIDCSGINLQVTIIGEEASQTQSFPFHLQRQGKKSLVCQIQAQSYKAFIARNLSQIALDDDFDDI